MSTTDPRKAKQYATRKDAVADAKAIGWQVNDVNPVEVMGFRLYTISDPHMNLLTAGEVTALKAAREASRLVPPPDSGTTATSGQGSRSAKAEGGAR